MGLVSIVFGIIGMAFAAISIRTFLSLPQEKQFWWYFHMRDMIASYIAAGTAFVVVNLASRFGKVWWIWLGPAVIGVPVSVLWQRYYRAKFAAKPRQPVQI